MELAEKPKEIEKIVEVEKIVETEKIVEREKIVEKEVEKIVETEKLVAAAVVGAVGAVTVSKFTDDEYDQLKLEIEDLKVG